MLDDNRKIGIGMTFGALLFGFLGVVLFFDRALLTLANLLFLGGVTLIIGPTRTVAFFIVPQRLKGTVCFATGLVMVLMGWCFTGLIVEGFGFINLFGDFFPYVLAVVSRIPIVGTILCGIPGIQAIADRVAPGGVPKMPV
jgi:hypothetical protein